MRRLAFLSSRLLLAYLLVLHTSFAYVLIKDDVPARLAVRLGLRDKPDWPGVELVREGHRQADHLVPYGSVIFLGDSITQGLPPLSAVSVNYGIPGQRSDQLLNALPVYSSVSRASAVVITIGTNDVLQGRTQGIEDRYRGILSKIPRHVRVILSAIPPMAARDTSSVVAAARNACAEDARCTFVPVPKLDLVDGVHLSPSGYSRWSELLRAAMTQATP